MDKYKDHLAKAVLNDGQLITYRSLSRALKVHVDLAKQMLFDFHQKQNAKRPGALHATYLVTGRRRPQQIQQTNGTQSQNGEDSFMQSSPFMSSSMPMKDDEETEEEVKITTITLVQEEELEQLKTEYEEVTSIHMYSLEPGRLQDVHLLTSCNFEIASQCAKEDPMEGYKQYGTIYNPNAKRRTMRRQPPNPAAAASVAAVKAGVKPPFSAATEKSAAPVSKAAELDRSRPTTLHSDVAATSKKTEMKTSLKRESSDLFKSFAKSKPPKAKAAENPPEDEAMVDFSDDDVADEPTAEEIEAARQDKEARDAESAKTRKAREEREENLRQMMDEEDDPMDDAPPAAQPEVEDVSDDQALDSKTKPTDEPSEAAVTVADGRRRGRRRVMKKKRVRDEEGYMVTKEEAVWESFSEEEPEQKKQKPQRQSLGGGAKAGGKAAGRPGQGNIMSFFTKK